MLEIDSLLKDLNDPQAEAVKHTEGPLLILAGAGTGKTKVLTCRIAYIISKKLAMPHNILAVTFTNKAANEMKERINNLIQADGLYIGTFHSIAIKMLRSHIYLLGMGFTSNFTVVNQDDQIKLVKELLLQNNFDIKNTPPKLIHVIISRWKDQGIVPDKLNSSEIVLQSQKVAQIIYAAYQRQLSASNAMDFGDILLYCNQMLIKNPDILEYYQNRFSYILIDEYQDTNAVQYIWARMLASKHQNICCVGDDDQSIYSWRGAEVKNILRFEKDFSNARVIKLEQNYRSSSYILEAASSLIDNNQNRHGKKLWTNQAVGQKLKIVSCWNDREEARYIATEIGNLMNSGKYKANQIAILVRAGFQTRAFEEVFISNALPYQIIGGLRFYERMEIRDLLAYIRLAINHNDNLALERIINVPKRAIGNVTLKKVKDYANSREISAFQAIKNILESGELKGKVCENLQNFIDLIELSSSKFKELPALEVTKFILEESGYTKSLKENKDDESRSRLENISEMLRAVGEFDNIEEFVEHSSLVMNNEILEQDFGGTIKLMTLHAAKGLEFEAVFLPGWEEGIFPHQKSIEENGKQGLEEERRIAYVGITRAKNELYITHAENRRIYAEITHSLPSRFLAEIPADLYEKLSSSSSVNYNASRHNFSLTSNKNSHDSAKNNFAKHSMKDIEMIPKRAGSKVRHVKFGNGIVVKKEGDNLQIVFEQMGLKTIKESYVEEIT